MATTVYDVEEIELQNGSIVRRSKRAGGTEGGISNGDLLRVRAAMKPMFAENVRSPIQDCTARNGQEHSPSGAGRSSAW